MPDPEPSCHRLAARGVAVLLAVGATTLLLDRGELGPATLAHSVGVSSIGLGLLLSLLADRGRGRLRLDVVELVMLVALAWLFVALTWHPAPFVGLHQTLTWLTLPMAYIALRRSTGGAVTWNLLWGAVCTTTLGLLCLSSYELLVLERVPRTLFQNQNSLAAWMTMIALVNGGLAAGLAFSRHRVAAAAVGAIGVAAAALAVSIASRGALVALLAGSAVLMTQLARQHVSSRYRHVLAVGLAALAVAIALGIAVSPRSTIERFVEFVGNPILAAGSRLLTWDAALRLATDCAPWGCGAGLFWLLFRGYQMPTDASAGFHAHLDPLEILVELGWPGLALLVALTAAVVMRTREAWRACANDPASQARLAGCGAALAAFMTHSLVTFNLYVAALVALAGLIMGGIGLAPPERRVAHPMARGSRFTAVALAAGIGAYLSATAYGAHFYHQAVSAPDAPSINELRERLEHARRFAPGADVVLVARADLELRVLESLFRVPGTPAAELSSQFDLASYFVDRTVRVNPLRPDGHEFRGRLELMDWRRPGPERVAAAIEAYAAALERSPGRPDVREQLGQMMQSLGRHGAAAGLFADGVAWAKTSSDELRFGIQALRAYVEAGDHDAARALRETVVAAAERERRRGNDLGDVAGMADALLDGMAP